MDHAVVMNQIFFFWQRFPQTVGRTVYIRPSLMARLEWLFRRMAAILPRHSSPGRSLWEAKVWQKGAAILFSPFLGQEWLPLFCNKEEQRRLANTTYHGKQRRYCSISSC